MPTWKPQALRGPWGMGKSIHRSHWKLKGASLLILHKEMYKAPTKFQPRRWALFRWRETPAACCKSEQGLEYCPGTGAVGNRGSCAWEVFCSRSECGCRSGFRGSEKVRKVLERYRGKPGAAGTGRYLWGSMKPGRLQNLLCSWFFQDYCQDCFFVCVFFGFVVFILLQLWLPLLTDKSVLPLLGKVVLWKSAKSGVGYQTKGALEPVWFLTPWKTVLMQAKSRRLWGDAGSRCWYMSSGWVWSCAGRQSKPPARGQWKDWDHHS